VQDSHAEFPYGPPDALCCSFPGGRVHVLCRGGTRLRYVRRRARAYKYEKCLRSVMVRERAWGETTSIEAYDGVRKVFSFQVAVRSVELSPPVRSPWGRIPIETLDDNIASKMMALVARGAPRDFVDIKEVVDAGLVSPARCWELWAAKRPGIEFDDARVRVQTHLARIEARMPIDRLPVERRDAAVELRRWYRGALTDRLVTGRGEDQRDGEEPSP